MAKELKVRWLILAAGIVLYIGAVTLVRMTAVDNEVKFLIFLAIYLVAAFESFRGFQENVIQKKILDEHFLMIVATVGALAVGHYEEGVAAMLLFQIGGSLEAVSVDRTKRTIAKYIDIRPMYAMRKEGEQEVQVEPSSLQIGDIIVIKPGERVPVDAVVTSVPNFSLHS